MKYIDPERKRRRVVRPEVKNEIKVEGPEIKVEDLEIKIKNEDQNIKILRYVFNKEIQWGNVQLNLNMYNNCQ